MTDSIRKLLIFLGVLAILCGWIVYSQFGYRNATSGKISSKIQIVDIDAALNLEDSVPVLFVDIQWINTSKSKARFRGRIKLFQGNEALEFTLQQNDKLEPKKKGNVTLECVIATDGGNIKVVVRKKYKEGKEFSLRELLLHDSE